MSIHIILGKPGSGKSMLATTYVARELIETKRNVVTNLPLRPAALNEYLQKRWPNVNTNFVNRLRVLTDDELKTFWKFRGPEDDRGENGVAYFLDEAHIAFNAREWASLGRAALDYLSQHRKLGDVVFPITQSPGNLDKQFRSVAEDFTVVRNEYTAKYGIFRGRGRFVRRTYLQEPTPNGEPFETATFSLDVEGIASCYDTAKGIGVHGSKADIGRRAKGIPIWTVVPAALVLALMCVAVPYLLGRGASKFLTKGSAVADPGHGTQAQEAAAGSLVSKRIDGSPPSNVRGRDRVPEVKEKYPIEPDNTPASALYVSGYLVRNQKVNVVLSDGRVLTEGDGLLARVSRSFVDLTDGRRLWLRTLKSSRPVSPVSAPKQPESDRAPAAKDPSPSSVEPPRPGSSA